MMLLKRPSLIGLLLFLTPGLGISGACPDYKISRAQQFEAVCREHFTQPDGMISDRLTAEDATTFNRLFAIYQKDTSHSGENRHEECLNLQRHWSGKRLDLSGQGRVSVPVVLKLDSVSSLNLANSKLLNCDAKELLGSSGTSEVITKNLEELNLSQNDLTDIGQADLSQWRSLVKLHLNNNDLTFDTNRSPFKFSGSKLYYLDLSQNPSLEIKEKLSDDFYSGIIFLNLSGIHRLTLERVLAGVSGRFLKIFHARDIAIVESFSGTFFNSELLFFTLTNSILSPEAADKIDRLIREGSLPKYARFDLTGTSLADKIYEREAVDFDVAVTPSEQECQFESTKELVHRYPDFTLYYIFDPAARLTSIGLCGTIKSTFLGIDQTDFTVDFPQVAPLYLEQLTGT